MSYNTFDQWYRRWYGTDPAKYDARFDGAFAALQSDFIIELLQPRAGQVILDVGTGTGRASLTLASRSEATVVGIDITPAMLHRAAEKRDAANLRYPAFVCGNGRTLPFPDNTFNTVVSIRMLHLFPTPHLGTFVDEMKRVLKPGGTLMIEFNSPLAAGGWIMARELMRHTRGYKRRYYLWPQHLDALFGDMWDRQVYGFWLPGIGPLSRRSPRFQPLLRLARIRPPFGYVGDKVLVRSRKPTG